VNWKISCRYYWGHGKLGRCVIQLSKFLNHTLATHNQVDSFFENINHNDGKGAFTLTLFEMTITDCPGFHVPHCIPKRYTLQKMTKFLRSFKKYNISRKRAKITNFKNLYNKTLIRYNPITKVKIIFLFDTVRI
jgi:hypothetical protein